MSTFELVLLCMTGFGCALLVVQLFEDWREGPR